MYETTYCTICYYNMTIIPKNYNKKQKRILTCIGTEIFLQISYKVLIDRVGFG